MFEHRTVYNFEGELYTVYTFEGDTIMIAPMSTIQLVLRLHKDAVKRIETELQTEVVAVAHFNHRRPLGDQISKVVIQRAPIQSGDTLAVFASEKIETA